MGHGKLTFEAESHLKSLVSSPHASFISKNAEKAAKANAQLARVSLLRLSGRDTEALQVLRECAKDCQNYGDTQEWASHIAWACRGNLKEKFCP